MGRSPLTAEALVRAAVDAFNARDADAFAALAHPRFVFHPVLTRSRDGGPYRGPEGARQYLQDAHAWAPTWLDLDEVLDHGDVVVSRCRLHMRFGEDDESVPAVYVTQLADGLVVGVATLADLSPFAARLGVAVPPPPGPPLHVVLPAQPASVPALRSAAREYAASRGLEDLHAVELAVTEAATNAVLHAFHDREPGTLELRGEDTPDGVLIRVADDGRGLLPRQDSPGLGIGLPLMQRLTAEVSFVGAPQRAAGTEVRLRFDRGAAAPPATSP